MSERGCSGTGRLGVDTNRWFHYYWRAPPAERTGRFIWETLTE